MIARGLANGVKPILPRKGRRVECHRCRLSQLGECIAVPANLGTTEEWRILPRPSVTRPTAYL